MIATMPTLASIPRPHTYYSASLDDDTAWPVLEGDHSADVVVIGGGFTGVNTALELAERGYSVVLVEANRVGWGQSGRNGGQVTGSLSGEGELRKQWKGRLGAELDDFIWWLRWHGQDVIAARVARHGIACDLKRGHIHAAMKPAHMAELEETFAQGCARGMGDDLVLLDGAGVRDHLESPLYCGGLLNTRNMHLHPLKLCLGEAKAAERLGVRIFEDRPCWTSSTGRAPGGDGTGARHCRPSDDRRGCLSQAGAQAAVRPDLSGRGRHRHHCAAGRCGQGNQPARPGGL
jgi:glycine/D-amino acid oxidase-like deaminating enzyme